MEDGCLEQGNVLFESKVPKRSVVTIQTHAIMSCKERRRARTEALRAKRELQYARRKQLSARSHLQSCGTVSSDSSVDSSVCYPLSKEELRRKRNRESAERSRLRKLALIDHLSTQAAILSARLQQLCAQNQRLRAGDYCAVQADGSSDGDGDLSTLSGCSSPCRAPSPYFVSPSPAGTAVLGSDDSAGSVSSLAQVPMEDVLSHFVTPTTSPAYQCQPSVPVCSSWDHFDLDLGVLEWEGW